MTNVGVEIAPCRRKILRGMMAMNSVAKESTLNLLQYFNAETVEVPMKYSSCRSAAVALPRVTFNHHQLATPSVRAICRRMLLSEIKADSQDVGCMNL